jgi:recombination protein RecA
MNAAVIRRQVEATLAHRVPSALTPRPAFSPQLLPTGIAEVDALTGGFPRGGLTEICGPASSGRTGLLVSFIAQLTQTGEACTLIDAGNSFDPHSAAEAGVVLSRLLWVRCGNSAESEKIGKGDAEISTSIKVETKVSPLVQSRTSPLRNHDYGTNNREGNIAREFAKAVSEPGTAKSSEFFGGRAMHSRKPEARSALEQALKAADLLLESGGFGAVILDLGEVPMKLARRVPLTSWFRFRRTVEHTDTALVVLEAESNAKTCASLVLEMRAGEVTWTRAGDGDAVLSGLSAEVVVARSRMELPNRVHNFPARKMGQSASFRTRAIRYG